MVLDISFLYIWPHDPGLFYINPTYLSKVQLPDQVGVYCCGWLSDWADSGDDYIIICNQLLFGC